jgi:hypothetical protein
MRVGFSRHRLTHAKPGRKINIVLNWFEKLKQQVKRNIDRFPPDFVFQLPEQATSILLSQNVIPSRRSLGGFLPYAFIEQGVAMLSSVLTSKRVIQVNIAIKRFPDL